MSLFLYNYIKSMRLYYAFITGISGWVGVSFYEFLNPNSLNRHIKICILSMLFLSWGINQIINDFLGLKEDKINAPNRPMVNGNLKVKPALLLTILLLTLMSIITYFLNPLALIPAISGIILNVIYQYAKSFSLLGNLIFGIMIAMCPIYGFLACGPLLFTLNYLNILSVLSIITFLNGLMTYYTYFKDYLGDKETGKNTFIVKYGIQVSKNLGLAAPLIFILMISFFLFKSNLMNDLVNNNEFIFCSIISAFLLLWTGFAYFKNPIGKKTYFNLSTNIRACCASQCVIISIFNRQLSLFLLISSYIFIGFLFNYYSDELS
ncbi:MAG: UbiA family prenyltransferase [Bacteroidetes bacterium]|nr:UbiA family prenyltransferase [Bacteroidota bacterium]